jgi:hypothetical protein
MTTLSAALINSLQLPMADVELLFRVRLQQIELGDLSQFANDWLDSLRKPQR